MKDSYSMEISNGMLQASLHGETSLQLVTSLKEEIVEALDRSDLQVLAVDVSGLVFMNTIGINMLVLLRKLCSEKSVDFVLLRPSEQVLKVLKLVQLADYFVIKEQL